MDTTQVLKGVLDVAVLGALRDRNAYGYSLIRRLREHGFTDVGHASVYGTLRRLHNAGLLDVEIVKPDGGPPRKYYRLTPFGEAELLRSVKQWEGVTAAMKSILKKGDEQDGQDE